MVQTFNKQDMATRGHSDYIVWWALLEATSDCFGKSSVEDHKRLYNNNETVEVVFKMNGVNIDFRKVMTSWQKQIGRMIVEKAQELIDNEMEEQVHEFYDTIATARSKLKEQIKNLTKGSEA